MQGQDLAAICLIRLGYIHQPVKPSAPEKRRIDDIRTVRSRKHHHIIQLLDPVHLGEDLIQHILGRPVPV